MPPTTDFLTEVKPERDLFTNSIEKGTVSSNLEASEYRKTQFATK